VTSLIQTGNSMVSVFSTMLPAASKA
jgi:hypothetical protein